MPVGVFVLESLEPGADPCLHECAELRQVEFVAGRACLPEERLEVRLDARPAIEALRTAVVVELLQPGEFEFGFDLLQVFGAEVVAEEADRVFFGGCGVGDAACEAEHAGELREVERAVAVAVSPHEEELFEQQVRGARAGGVQLQRRGEAVAEVERVFEAGHLLLVTREQADEPLDCERCVGLELQVALERTRVERLVARVGPQCVPEHHAQLLERHLVCFVCNPLFFIFIIYFYLFN